jgi:CrcB protein
VEVLGGFTTFSVYVIDVQRALAAGAPRTALAYLAVTMVAALGSVYAGSAGRRLLTLSRGKGPAMRNRIPVGADRARVPWRS